MDNMFTAYGEGHRRLRSLVSGAFSARRVAALHPEIEEITGELAASLPGDANLREGFAYPLPIEVICRLRGVPDNHCPGLRRFIDGVFDTTTTAEEALANEQQLYTILDDLIELMRTTPGDDLASALIAAGTATARGSPRRNRSTWWPR
ncbi:hypothetical protein [Streptomyces sp. JNUCC 63]